MKDVMTGISRSKSRRIVWVDAYKAFLIVLVVLGHSFQSVVADFDGNIVVKCIYSHHMAAFFFLSGFVTWRPEFRFASLWRKLGDLLVPFFLWWLIGFFCAGRHNLFGGLCSLVRNPDTGLWFLYVLAACHAINFTVRSVCGRLRFNGDIGLLIATGGLMAVEMATGWNNYGFHFLAWYNIFYMMGFWARKYGNDFLDGLCSRQCLLLALPLLAAWAVLMPCWQRNTAITVPLLGQLPSTLAFVYRFLAIVLAVGWELLLFSRCGNLPRAVEVLGRNTLGIYAVHGLLLAYLAPMAKALGSCMAIPSLFVVTLALSAALVTGIRRLPAVGKWLVGR